MTDETAKTKAWSRPDMDTDVHAVLASRFGPDVPRLLDHYASVAAERAAARAVEATRECDLETTQAVKAEALKAAAKAAEVAADSGDRLKQQVVEAAVKEAKRSGKKFGYWLAAAVTAFAAAGGFGVWKLAGPEQAVKKAEAAVEKAETKGAQLDAATSELAKKAAKFDELTEKLEQDRKTSVDGRLVGLEGRMGKVEGGLAGVDAKIDTLLDHELGRPKASEAKAKAAKVAAKREADSGP